MIKKLTWDSDFFELNVGEVIFKKEKLLNNYTFDLIYIKSNSDFELNISNYINTLSETKILYSKKLNANSNSNSNVNLKIQSFLETNYDIEDLYLLAFESGKFSRFKLDENIKNVKFEALYKKWIDNSVSLEFATDILLYQINNQTIGFLSYKIYNNFVNVGLFSVLPNHQGKGVGKCLLNQLESILANKNIHEIQIPTQLENIAACHFYDKVGYKIKETTYLKHYWKK